ncbi:MAG: hypothetical protein KBS75_09255 [Bacteroidales bacterium]|nr:hypothetical protein [Candidatus Equimonas faecalis]
MAKEKVEIVNAFDGNTKNAQVFMYEFVNGDKGFVVNWFSTDDHYSQISEEKYEAYKAMGKDAFREEIKKGLSAAILSGYGFYGCDLVRVNGIPMVMMRTGSSCD